MAQNSRRNKRRRPSSGAQAQPANGNGNGQAHQNGPAASNASPDRYQKYLPEWMKGTNGAMPPRPRGPRRARPPRPAGGYTPGKSIGSSSNGMGDF